MEDQIILVDASDKQVGVAGKLEAHQKGQLHRAFSVFVFNPAGQLLLQRRALSKYHSGGLWTNTCCSHPRAGELTHDAAVRRLKEEMGFTCPLREVFSFTYSTNFSDGLIENEFDHVFVGEWEGKPSPDPEEVEEWKWIEPDVLKKDAEEHPEKYSYWLKVALPKVLSVIR